MLTRRELLLELAATAAAAGVGGGGFVAFRDNYGPWLREVLRAHLPGHAFDPDGLDRYVREYTAKKNSEGAYRLEIYALAEQVFDPTAIAPAFIAEKIAEEERRILTGFLMGSDFFSGDRPPHTITYHGSDGACVNPFATF